MLPFTGNPLNRLSEKRPDAAWVAEKLAQGRVLPVWRMQVLTSGDKIFSAASVPQSVGQGLAAADAVCVFLGMDGEAALFALDVSAAQNADEALKEYGEFRELRGAAPFLRRNDLAILSQAKALVDWHQRHGFCARCGAATEIADAGYRRHCPRCEADHFPRTDPAVIMLATHGDECLLARNVKWAPEFYSTLAGFVEPGESLEEAVRRETFEEAGLVVGKVTYFASQPWPFPASLMIGCFAECESKQLMIDLNELADAQWFTKDRALDLIEGRIEGRRGPMSVAIAYHLVREWATK
jgi:NAD+ diphosphatase